MGRDRDLTSLGRALGAPARSVMVNLLLDGARRPAGELAAAAGVRPSTASEHLAVLVETGLVTAEAHGRHRYYALAGPEVASALEALGAIASPLPVAGLRRSRQAEHLAAARLCYDHLAGRLGVALTDAWVQAGWLVGPDQLALAPSGADGLRGLGVDVDGAARARRPTTRACLDWTERRPHLAGALGAAVGARFLAAGWVVRHRSGRGLDVTAHGSRLLEQRWGIGRT
ncbi:ArsR/SmtB family transcription factor [Cellulomonas wangsupingiae]|uniref:Winged helix-turn-helix domain-containing protein n=1 Tax=Cellulomonas wangsupingiae TaxID=2968085 RepID=A0ABY5K8M4_9CELL|nr:winged helix-turn-helix domain-containing protein [Cellulomonas wangsupingiae]MCC2333098.1 winged helix-turn-helix domain-containing protein [Cellulomonas wangsupingiae]MCM0640457.1 winged helix-turn-helix domain-containing protein [Cellulomonas wangsupingiae]UUI66814.1 winged helix-turn-helix domain-containing protein [Cellulomonas wangsupingiae]